MAIGEAIEGELKDRAEKSMKAGVASPSENFPEGQVGRVSDQAAQAAGFGNGKTYEQSNASKRKQREPLALASPRHSSRTTG